MRRFVVLLLAALMLTACGTTPQGVGRDTRLTTVRVGWRPDTLAALPFCVASREGWLGHAGFRLVHAGGGIAVGDPGSWPVVGLVLQRSEWVLAAPRPEPDFRWRDLVHLPLGEVGLGAGERQLMVGLLKEHGVADIHWDPIAARDARHLLTDGHVLWALMPLLTAVRLNLPIVAFAGASSGPLPAAVMQAAGAPPSFLAVVNRALAFVRDRQASTVAAAAAACYPDAPPHVLAAAVRDAQGLGLFSGSTYLPPSVFRAGSALAGLAGVTWPAYSSAAHMHDALRALSIWP